MTMSKNSGNAVLISIRPMWCELIAGGKKTTEIRKTCPKIATPFKCYIYQTKHKWACSLLRSFGCEALADRLESECGMVIGEFICNRIHKFQVFDNGNVQDWWFGELNKSCLKYDEISNYIGRNKRGFSWNISELKIYDKPKNINDFSTCLKGNNQPIKRPPQSWCYVKELDCDT